MSMEPDDFHELAGAIRAACFAIAELATTAAARASRMEQLDPGFSALHEHRHQMRMLANDVSSALDDFADYLNGCDNVDESSVDMISKAIQRMNAVL